MSSTIPRVLCIPLFAVLSIACASDRPPAAATPAAPVVSPAPVAPVAPAAAGHAKAAEPQAKTSPPALVLTSPAGWIAEEPSSSSRKAQFRLPHADSDSEDASLIVYFFGGQGGGTHEANLERWAGQFEQPDGSPSSDVIESSSRKIAGLEVFEASLSGTYVAETSPGSGEHVNKPGWRMQASIVETADGPWYFKLVGPAATVAKWETSYADFLNAIRPRR